MTKHLFFCILFCISFFNLNAQFKIDSTGLALQQMANMIQKSENIEFRKQTDSLMTLKLWETLATNNAFNFHFDSLQSIRQIVAPDGNFKIFTWQLELEDEQYLQKGIIQYKNTNGSIQLENLIENKDQLEEDNFIGSSNNWKAAIYYDIILNEYNGVKYYTLLGFKLYNTSITQKLIEVLHFQNDKPIFGGDYFEYPKDDTYPAAPIARFIYSYKKGSNAIIQYNKEAKAIVVSELTSITNHLNEKSTLVPTGNEMYFVWKNGKWIMPNK